LNDETDNDENLGLMTRRRRRVCVLINLIHFWRSCCSCSCWQWHGANSLWREPAPGRHQILTRFPRQLTFTRGECALRR